MLGKQLKNIIHLFGQRKELIAIYCFEEYLCDVFLSNQVVDPYQAESWADYLTWTPYCLLLLIGLGISHLSRRREKKLTPTKNALHSIVGKLQNLQQRFPIAMALVSILLVLAGEILEQELLETIHLVLISTNPSTLFLMAFPLVNLLMLLIDFLLSLPFIITVLAFCSVLPAIYDAINLRISKPVEVATFLEPTGFDLHKRSRPQSS